jgi:hypothetical protein
VLRVRSAPFAEFLELDLPLHQLAVLARPIIDASALRAREFEKLVLGHMGETIRQRGLPRNSLADCVPRQERRPDERAHDDIDDKPSRENDDEPYGNVLECFDCPIVLTGIGHIGEIEEAGPREEDGREHDGQIDRGIEDVLRKLSQIAHGRAATGVIAIRRNDGGDPNGRHRDCRRYNDNEQKHHQEPERILTFHTKSLPRKSSAPGGIRTPEGRSRHVYSVV